MGKKEKLINRLKTVPKDFTFDEMKTLLELLGYKMSNKGKTSGSRVMFTNEGKLIILHKPHPNKEIPVYQIRQVIKKLEEEDFI